MGIDEKAAGEVIRVSIGRDTTRSQVYEFIDKWQAIFDDARRV
jgi:cysteine desulfurase